MEKNHADIDSYINACAEDIQPLLKQMRKTISQAAPEAMESIKYAMPTFELDGNLVHFAACKNHIGFYPTPSAIVAFQKELVDFDQSKGSIHFPLDKQLPLELVDKIVRFRVRENQERIALKKMQRKNKAR